MNKNVVQYPVELLDKVQNIAIKFAA